MSLVSANRKVKLAMVLALALSFFVTPIYAQNKSQSTSEVAALVAKGEEHCKVFKFKEAEPLFRQALQANEKCVPALLGLSRVSRHQGKAQLSYAYVKSAIQLEPENAQCYLTRAKIDQACHRYASAIEACNKALKLSPNLAEAFYYLGWNQYLATTKNRDTNQCQSAEKNLRRAVELDAKNDGALRILSHLLWREKRYAEASLVLQSAIKTFPAKVSYRIDLANIYLAQGKVAQAKGVYNEIKKNFPKIVEPYLGLAKIAQAEGHLPQQEALLKQATVVKPTSELAWLELAQYYCTERKMDESLRCARIACGFNPRSATNNSALAIALINADKPKEAEPYLQKSAELAQSAEQKLRIQGILVRLDFLISKNDQAMALAKQMYQQAPGNLNAISAMAWALMCFKKYDEGFALLKEAKKKFPHQVDIDLDYMAGLYSAERYSEAKILARQLTAKIPHKSEPWLCLMEIAKKTHNKKDAEEAMKHLEGLKLTASEAMEVGFDGLNVGAGNKSLPSLKKALDSSPESADLLLNTRDPKNERNDQAAKH